MTRYVSILYVFIVILSVSCQQKSAHVYIQPEEKNTDTSFETREEREKRQKEEAEKRQMIELRRKSVTIEEAEQIRKYLLDHFGSKEFDEVMLKYVRRGFGLFYLYTFINDKKILVGNIRIYPSVTDNVFDNIYPTAAVLVCGTYETSAFMKDTKGIFTDSSRAEFKKDGIFVEIRFQINESQNRDLLIKEGYLDEGFIGYHIVNGFSAELFISKEMVCDRIVKALFCYTYFPGKDFDYYWNIQAYGEPIIIKNINIW